MLDLEQCVPVLLPQEEYRKTKIYLGAKLEC